MSYTNSVGQTIQPGDKVVAIASGYSHSIHERVGTFVGLSPSGYPQARVKTTIRKWKRLDGTIGAWERGAEVLRSEVEVVRTYSAGRIYKLA